MWPTGSCKILNKPKDCLKQNNTYFSSDYPNSLIVSLSVE